AMLPASRISRPNSCRRLGLSGTDAPISHRSQSLGSIGCGFTATPENTPLAYSREAEPLCLSRSTTCSTSCSFSGSSGPNIVRQRRSSRLCPQAQFLRMDLGLACFLENPARQTALLTFSFGQLSSFRIADIPDVTSQ